MTALTIEIGGEFVALRGTTKGDAAQRAAIARPWVWGGRAGAWVLPRNLRPETRTYAIQTVKAALEAAGFEVELEDSGERLSEAERREASAERLEHRADRYEARSESLADEAERRWAASDRLQAAIPFGQPVLVGHHSQRRHERDLDRIRRDVEKGVEAHRASKLLADRAAGIRRELAGTPLVTLRNRIAKNEAETRRCTRRIEGTDPSMSYGTPAAGEWLERLTEMRQRAQEALELDRAEVERRRAEGFPVWGPEDFKPGDKVLTWGGWREVVRVNKVTLTCTSGYSWHDKIEYQKIRDHRPLTDPEAEAL